jgi:hypothetical protein
MTNKKIFISHSSKDKFYGDQLVELLKNFGIEDELIVYTSSEHSVHCIPLRKNIYDWLKEQITKKPFFIYLLSEDYYKSLPCLNEMGACWIINNEPVAIFRPDFNLSSDYFQGGALNPRDIGFYINNEARIFELKNSIYEYFEGTIKKRDDHIVKTKIGEFINNINNYEKTKNKPNLNGAAQTPKSEANDVNVPLLDLLLNKPKLENDITASLVDLLKSDRLNNADACFLDYLLEKVQKMDFIIRCGLSDVKSQVVEINRKSTRAGKVSGNNHNQILETLEKYGFVKKLSEKDVLTYTIIEDRVKSCKDTLQRKFRMPYRVA